MTKLCFQLLIVWLLTFKQLQAELLPPQNRDMKLFQSLSGILCSFGAKTIHVYFENKTSRGHPSQILPKLNACGISYISLRSKYRTIMPLQAIQDDGVLMYLVMMLHNASQTIEFSIIAKNSAAKHLTHVLLVIEDSRDITLDWLSGTFRKYWQQWVPNVAIMFWRHQRLQVYRYNPFAANFLIQVKWTSNAPSFLQLFPKTLPNMQGKPLRVCLYHEGVRAIFLNNGRVIGSDGLLASFIASSLNATLVVHRLSMYGVENNTADICFREVQTGTDDVAMNIRFLALSTFQKRVEYTIVHRRDDLCVLVPKAQTASTFGNLFRTYSVVVWSLILLTLLLTYGFCLLLHHQFHYKRQVLLLQLFGSLVSVPFTSMPLRPSLRLFCFFWLLYGLLICGAFKGNLTSSLVFRTYLPDVNTLQDLALSPYKLLLFPRHLKHLNEFLNTSNRYEALIKRNMLVTPDAALLEHIRSNNLSYAYLVKLHYAKFQVNDRRHTQYGRPFYHVMDTCIVPFHAVFIVPYGSPYLGYINILVRSSHEFGFANYWEGMMKAVLIKYGKSVKRSQGNDDDPVVLRLAHFQAAFCLLGLGVSLSLLVFICETYWSSGQKSSTNKGRHINTNAYLTQNLNRHARRCRFRHFEMVYKSHKPVGYKHEVKRRL